jgi:hypothetical protein
VTQAPDLIIYRDRSHPSRVGAAARTREVILAI